jgi:hypothetical protein
MPIKKIKSGKVLFRFSSAGCSGMIDLSRATPLLEARSNL